MSIQRFWAVKADGKYVRDYSRSRVDLEEQRHLACWFGTPTSAGKCVSVLKRTKQFASVVVEGFAIRRTADG